MNWQAIADFFGRHKEVLIPLGIAMAVTMRPKLPWPFVLIEPLEWSYEWFRDGLLTFISMRGPAHSEATVKKDIERSTETDPSGKKVETVKESSSGMAQEGDAKQGISKP